MPIAKRTINIAPVRWTHQIETKQYTAKLRIVQEKVASAEPQLHSLIGQRYDKVREIASQRGWDLLEIPKK